LSPSLPTSSFVSSTLVHTPTNLPSSVGLHAMTAASPESTNQVSADDPSPRQQAVTTNGKGKNVDDGPEEGLNGVGGDRSSPAVSSVGGQNGSVRGAPTATHPEPVSVPADVAAHKSAQGDDAEKDKGSLSTTLIGTQKDIQTRVKANASSSEANGEKLRGTASTPSKPKSSSTRSNSSFLSKLVRRLVPCIASSRAHVIDIDDADFCVDGSELVHGIQGEAGSERC
jgi:RNA polymerase II subunit A small phosphatase-like protein